MSHSCALLIFAKVPKLGRVKTRLLTAVSPRTAAAIHAACLTDTLRLARSVKSCDVFLFGAGGVSYFKTAARAEFSARRAPQVFLQRGGDLGARLENAFRRVFALGYRRVVVIGTDTPWMRRARIQRAYSLLRHREVVLGPTADGGYYLLGARRFLPELFEGIPWSTHRVAKATLRAVKMLNVSAHVLPGDFDLDRPRDLRRAQHSLPRQTKRAPHLAALLTSLQRRKRNPS